MMLIQLLVLTLLFSVQTFAQSPSGDSSEDFSVQALPADGGKGSDQQPVQPALRVLTWHLRKSQVPLEHDRVVSILMESDVAVFQDLEFNERGETALTVLANLFEKRAQEHICKAWFRNEKGERGRHGFLFRESRLALVDQAGMIISACGTQPLVIHGDAKLSGLALFYSKPEQRLFYIKSIAQDAAVKKPDAEVPKFFHGQMDVQWPVIVAGDLRMNSKSPAFIGIRKANFKPAVKDIKRSLGYSNFWFKNLSLASADPINLKERYSDMAAKDLEAAFGDTLPVLANFSFSEQDAELLQIQMIKKKRAPASLRKPTPLAKESVQAFPGPVKPYQLSNLNDDLEAEARNIETAKKSVRRKNKKHSN